MKEYLNNVSVVYKHWKEKGYFSQNYARIFFISWIMLLQYWLHHWQFCKIFYDKLNKLDPNLLTDKKIINQQTKAEQNKLKKIIASASAQRKAVHRPRKFVTRRSCIKIGTKGKFYADSDFAKLK